MKFIVAAVIMLAWVNMDSAQMPSKTPEPVKSNVPQYFDFGKFSDQTKKSLEIAALLRSIEDCKAKKDYACMVELGTKGIASYPTDAGFYFKRGEGLANLSKFDASLADLSKALEMDPKSVDFLDLRALVYELTGKYDNAVTDYRKAIEIAPTSGNYLGIGQAINRIAIEKMKCGAVGSAASSSDCVAKLDEAVTMLTRGLNQTPEIAAYMFLKERAISYRAISKLGIDKTKEAKADEDRAAANVAKTTTVLIKKLEEVNKFQDELLSFLKQGNSCLGKKDYACAIQIANDGLKQYPGTADLLNLRGVGFSGQGKTDEAIADYTRAIEADPKIFNFFNNRGHAYQSSYEYDKAVADFTRVLDLNPKSLDALINRVRITVLQGQYESAESDLRKVVELDPQNEDAVIQTNQITTFRNAGFNTGKTKEDTLLRYVEYVGRIEKAANIFNENAKSVTLAVAEIPLNKEKVCRAVNDLKPSVGMVETYRIKLAQMISDQKFDKISDIKHNAAGEVAAYPSFKTSFDELNVRFGCK